MPPTEVWGYTVGDHVEALCSDGRWRHAVVNAITIERDINVKFPYDKTYKRIVNPKNIRRFVVPTGVDNVERWLQT